jgi:hypothetical protein
MADFRQTLVKKINPLTLGAKGFVEVGGGFHKVIQIRKACQQKHKSVEEMVYNISFYERVVS